MPRNAFQYNAFQQNAFQTTVPIAVDSVATGNFVVGTPAATQTHVLISNNQLCTSSMDTDILISVPINCNAFLCQSESVPTSAFINIPCALSALTCISIPSNYVLEQQHALTANAATASPDLGTLTTVTNLLIFASNISVPTTSLGNAYLYQTHTMQFNNTVCTAVLPLLYALIGLADITFNDLDSVSEVAGFDLNINVPIQLGSLTCQSYLSHVNWQHAHVTGFSTLLSLAYVDEVPWFHKHHLVNSDVTTFNPVVGSPIAVHMYYFVPENMEAASTIVDTNTYQQHATILSDIRNQSSVSQTSIEQEHQFTPHRLLSTTLFGDVMSVGDHHVYIDLMDLTVALTNIAPKQLHHIVPNNIMSSPDVASIAYIHNAVLAAQSLVYNTDLPLFDFITNHELQVESLLCHESIANFTLKQRYITTPIGMSASSFMPVWSPIEYHDLPIDNLLSNSEISSTLIIPNTNLACNSLLCNNITPSVYWTHNHIFTPLPIQVPIYVDGGIAKVGVGMQAVALTVGPDLLSIILSQTHNLPMSNLVAPSYTPTLLLKQAQILALDPMLANGLLSSVSIYGIHSLNPLGVHIPTVTVNDMVSIGQEHTNLPISILQDCVLEPGNLHQVHSSSLEDLSYLAVSDNLFLIRNYSLTGEPLLFNAHLDSVIFEYDFAFVPASLLSGYVLDNPVAGLVPHILVRVYKEQQWIPAPSKIYHYGEWKTVRARAWDSTRQIWL